MRNTERAREAGPPRREGSGYWRGCKASEEGGKQAPDKRTAGIRGAAEGEQRILADEAAETGVRWIGQCDRVRARVRVRVQVRAPY